VIHDAAAPPLASGSIASSGNRRWWRGKLVEARVVNQ